MTGRGFSMVEMMVALLFTSLLMAGLASVFRASMGSFVTSGERISSGRRNRMSVDMIYDDLNAAGMLLTSLADYGGSTANPITLQATNPPFRIIPNVAYAGTDVAIPNNVTDQLFLYFDEALPFEGTLSATTPSTVVLGAEDKSYDEGAARTITLRDETQAKLVEEADAQSPLSVLFRADIAHPKKPASLVRSDSSINVDMSSGDAAADLSNPDAVTNEAQLPANSGVLFVRPGRYVRYSIQTRGLDPDPANAGVLTPCLVRDEVIYSDVAGSATPFAAPITSTIIAENVIGFQVLVSPDGGQTWVNDPHDAAQRDGGVPDAATPGLPHTRFASWAELTGLLNANTRINTRPAPNNAIDDTRFWFKDIPVTVRVDITTRTARPRGEYVQNDPNTIILGTGGIPYKIQTQSVVLVPRHFGLSYGPGLL